MVVLSDALGYVFDVVWLAVEGYVDAEGTVDEPCELLPLEWVGTLCVDQTLRVEGVGCGTVTLAGVVELPGTGAECV